MEKKVLLIQPNYQIKKDAKLWACNPPLGLLYLAAVLEKEEIPVEIVDANLKNLSARKTASLIKRKGRKYVGFSILTPAADWCTQVVRQLPQSIIKIAGGPHASAMPENLLKSGFDIVVIGEGEGALAKIAKGEKFGNIRGIAYRRKKRILHNPPQLPLDLNKLPLPARHLVEKGGTDRPYLASGTRYFPWAPIITSRGCPFDCYFCSKKIFGHKFRARNPEDVLAEIDFLVNKYQIKEIDFYDDCFNLDIKRAEMIMDLIDRRGYKLHLRFNNGIRADRITKRLLLKMKKAGTDYIAYGIESGDQQILKLIPKREGLKQTRKAVRLTHEVGIPVAGFFIFGLIGDTKETMQKTINFAKSLPLDWAFFNIATPYPGTRMEEMIQQRGGKIFLTPWKDFHNVSGKMHYFLPDMASPVEVEEMYRRAYLSFYFRPEYIVKHIPDLSSLSLLPLIYRGLRKILYSQKVG